jgi:hypothetical protein
MPPRATTNGLASGEREGACLRSFLHVSDSLSWVARRDQAERADFGPSDPGFWFSESKIEGLRDEHADSGSPQRLLEDLSAKIDKIGESFDRRRGRIEGCLGIDVSVPDLPLRDSSDVLTVQFEHDDRDLPYGLLDEAGYWFERLLYGCVHVERGALDFLEGKNVKYRLVGDYAQLLSTEPGANELRDNYVLASVSRVRNRSRRFQIATVEA